MRLQHRSANAFTITEVLIASAITAVIVVLLGTMFSSLTGTSQRANQRIDAFRDARAALQMMERDLSGIVATVWTPNPFTSPLPSPTPRPLTRPAAYLAIQKLRDPSSDNQEIYALIPAKNSGNGDVCAVGYYCHWDAAQRAYSLRRSFRTSAQTYDVLSSPSPTPPPPSSPSPTATPAQVYVAAARLYPTPTPSGSPVVEDDVLAQYVWALKIVAYDSAGNALTQNGNPVEVVCDGSATSPMAVDPTPSPAPRSRPVAIDISFKAMSPNAARALISTGAGKDVWMRPDLPEYQRLIAPHAYSFSTRIKL